VPLQILRQYAAACRDAFRIGETVVDEIASCFDDILSPLFDGELTWDCIASADVYCPKTRLPPCSALATSTPQNALEDGGFESGRLWALSAASGHDAILNVSVADDRAHGGQYSLKAVFSNDNGGSRTYAQRVRLVPGAQHEIPWWFYSSNPAAATSSQIEFVGGGLSFLVEAPTQGIKPGRWIKVSRLFVAPASFGTVYFTVSGSRAKTADPQVLYVDDISIREVS